jgi:hypothetical protein
MLSTLFKARRRAKAASIFGRLLAHINRMNRSSNVGAQTLGPRIPSDTAKFTNPSYKKQTRCKNANEEKEGKS